MNHLTKNEQMVLVVLLLLLLLGVSVKWCRAAHPPAVKNPAVTNLVEAAKAK